MADAIQDLPGEIWKPVVGWEGQYEVSNMGRVFSVERMVSGRKRPDGSHHMRRCRARLLTPWLESGYPRVSMGSGRAEHPQPNIHRLVLEAFIGSCPDGMECCHGDGNKTNNRLDNLRWDTKTANQADRLAHGTACVGETHPNSKLTVADVRTMRERRARGEPLKSLARAYGVTTTTICDICKRHSWSHVV